MSTATLEQPRIAARLKFLPPRLGAFAAKLEGFIVPAENIVYDDRAMHRRSLRIVSIIAGLSVVIFLPALVIAGVPTELWLPFGLAVLIAVCVDLVVAAHRPRR